MAGTRNVLQTVKWPSERMNEEYILITDIFVFVDGSFEHLEAGTDSIIISTFFFFCSIAPDTQEWFKAYFTVKIIIFPWFLNFNSFEFKE